MISIDADDVRLLADIGFLALTAGQVARASTIFEGVEAARPGSEAAAVGRGLVLLAQNDSLNAINVLRQAEPTDAVQTFLGMAYHRYGMRSEARDVLQSVVDAPVPSPHAALAQMLIDEIDGK